MKAGVYYNNNDVRVEEIPKPLVGPDDVLINVKSSGICGSDLLEWYRIKTAPRVLGHELTGQVVETGRNVRAVSAGDRVFAIHHVPCNECHECLKGHTTACADFQGVNNFEPGGFSEMLKISGQSVTKGILKLPGNVSYDEGTFIEPLGTVLRGLRATGLKPGDTILVVGSGLSGLLHIQAARALGAAQIFASDILPSRLDAAKKFGADQTISAEKDIPEFIKKNNNGRLVDHVIICIGAPTAIASALASVGKGGSVLFFAAPKPDEMIGVDFNTYWRNDISLKTSYGSDPFDHTQALSLISSGRIRVNEMITHRFDLDNIGDAFKMASEATNCLKALITMNS